MDSPKEIPWDMDATTPESLRFNYLLVLAKAAVDMGFVPILLKGKIPSHRGWQDLRNVPTDRYIRVRNIAHILNSSLLRSGVMSKEIEDRNIGIVTGEASGVIVVDVDIPGAKFWNPYVPYLPPTTVVATPSGGRHYYFLYDSSLSDIKTSRGTLHWKGVDVRNNGGMVVFPGSGEESNPYAFVVGEDRTIPPVAAMPSWLVEGLRSRKAEMEPLVRT